MKNILFLFCVTFICQAQTNYYVDNVLGDDNFSGISEVTAFKTLNKVNTIRFLPGDTILFKRGGQWSGIFRPQGNGKAGNRIVIGSYGNGDLPVIDAEGQKGDTDFLSASLILFNQEYWEVRDIEIRNFEKGNPDRPVKKAGILVLAKDIGTLRDFKFENVKISDVNGTLKLRTNGGLLFNIIADSIPENRIPTNFDGIYVNNCHFINVDRGGFINQSFWRIRDMTSNFGELCVDGRINNWYPSYNIVIENSKFENIGGNGLVTRVANSPLVQYNLFVRNSLKTTGNASYPYNCDNALWQFNEAAYTIYNEGDIDASGFDSDYLCKNTIIQYNFSHHNDWGGLLVCSWGEVENAFNDGTIVRYNVFQDEKHHMIRFSGNITNTEISNNLFVTDTQVDDVMMWYKHWGDIWPDKTIIKDNVFYNEGTTNFLKLGATTNNSFVGNVLYGSEFSDFSEFESIHSKKDEKQLKSTINQVRKIGLRNDFSKSEAEEVIKTVWPDYLTLKNE
ncbi:hypothetical protein APS56_09915 [Pseudalgibacter alginicilyticus]|uniref:Right handed beta helix domain-containing protein n=1 Tax=Pseudalgibacter alginicilyticus TaxID=1736674 RepID=A0A0N7HYJ3_9FLAO|nr:hypothetical protein [Pseudalgibacter alginicilyticus]ALJ05414.1 hypothetical protein APS56_09915 [Pseudalgibacter alginicilyticus]